jgi:hypothetical protein
MATFGWIVFDALISARMMIGGYRWWEVALWALGGLMLAGYAWYREDRDTKATAEQMRKIQDAQTYQSGQLSAMTQLIGREAVKTLAEEWRVPITEVAREFMVNVRTALSEEPTLRSENERLLIENQQLRASGTPTFSTQIEAGRSPAEIARSRQIQAARARRAVLLKVAGTWVDDQKKKSSEEEPNGNSN